MEYYLFGLKTPSPIPFAATYVATVNDAGFLSSVETHAGFPFPGAKNRSTRRSTHCSRIVIATMGIEPTSEAWEACNLTRKNAGLAAVLQFSECLKWKIMENGN